jgi:hypothetical protein
VKILCIIVAALCFLLAIADYMGSQFYASDFVNWPAVVANISTKVAAGILLILLS